MGRASVVACAAAVVALGASSPRVDARPSAIPLTADDLAIFQVALDSVVRPESDRLGGGIGDAALPLVGRTLALCSARSPDRQQIGCVSEDGPVPEVGRLSTVFKDRLTEADRALMRTSFLERNRETATIPPSRLQRVTLMSPADVAAKYKETTGLGVSHAVLSLPGLSAGGRAVIYARFWCGNLCGYGWYILFDRTPSGWRYVAHAMLWIS
jgi:hypothetical protein